MRIVMTPETVVLAEARRSFTTLSLFGYRVDGVVVNRIFPGGDGDPWRAGWVEAQRRVLAEVEQSFAGITRWRSTYRDREPVGVEALRAFADEVYAGTDPLAPPDGVGPLSLSRTSGEALLTLALPGATRSDVDLARHGDDLVVTVGAYRRLLTLPPGLSRHTVRGARVVDGVLQVRFGETASEQARSEQTTSEQASEEVRR